MRVFARTLILHTLYIVFVIAAEISVGSWLTPMIGGFLTALILIALLIGFIVLYAVLFWKWIPTTDNKVFDFFADIATFIID